MTLAAAKVKLHEYIDNADAKEANALFSLLNSELSNPAFMFDEGTIEMLEQRWERYLSGEAKVYTVAESMENIRTHRGKNAL